MAKSIKYKEADTFHDAGNVYDFIQKKTQEEVNSSLKADKCGDLIFRLVETEHLKGKVQPIPIEAPDIEGYSFFLWGQVTPNGWGGSPYVEHQDWQQTQIYDTNIDTSNDSFYYYALAIYKKN